MRGDDQTACELSVLTLQEGRVSDSTLDKNILLLGFSKTIRMFIKHSGFSRFLCAPQLLAVERN